jgi:aspartate/methionine/tyrosine aminotransferase
MAALRALEAGASWVESAHNAYREVGDAAAAILGQPPPQGSTFLFLDVQNCLDDRGLHGLLADCFEDGVLVAPGGSSGEAYAEWVRLCYTSVAPDQVLEAVRRLAARLR